MPAEEFVNGLDALMKCTCYLEENKSTPAIPVSVYFGQTWKTKLQKHLETTTIDAPSGDIGDMTDTSADFDEKEEASPIDDVLQHSLPSTDDSSSHDLMHDQYQDKSDSSVKLFVDFIPRLMRHLFLPPSKVSETQFVQDLKATKKCHRFTSKYSVLLTLSLPLNARDGRGLQRSGCKENANGLHERLLTKLLRKGSTWW